MVGVDLGICGINQWNDPPYTPNPTPGTLAAWGSAGSLHPDGAHVVMADGSVHFLSENTDLVILENLSTFAGGEVVAVP